MTRQTSSRSDPDASTDREAHHEEIPGSNVRDEIRNIPVLSPWTDYVAHEPSFSEELNQDLAIRVRELVFDQLEKSYVRLKRQQEESDNSGIISKRANRTLLENRLAVEAKRKIDLEQITFDMKTAMMTGLSMVNGGSIVPRRVSSPLHRRARDTSVIAQMMSEKEAKKLAAMSAAAAVATYVKSTEAAKKEPEHAPKGPLFVEFPPSEHTLSDLVDQAQSSLTAADMDNQVTNFRHRPVSQSAVDDAGRPVSRRETKPDRVRYIMSTRLGALPPTKNILEEYAIPKEILDALDKHRHYHVDESSLMASFDTMKAGGTGDWECYYRRSVPVERKPISFVLSSLEIANERPVPPPSDIFQQNLLDSATNEDTMLTEVRQLYDHTHESYREFRSSLHRHLDLQYLVDLSLRSSLNSTSYFLEDEIVSSEPTVQIPTRLLRSSNSVVSKWRLAKKGAIGTGARFSNRRGAIAVQVKNELTKNQRNDLITQICQFSPNEVHLMDLWYSYDPDAIDATPFDPIPMLPDLSARFDAVWKDLQMPAKERLDLAVKYSSLENSSRLPDAVLLWEVTTVLIKEREDLLRLARAALTTPKKTMAMISEETALLQDLAQTTTHLKEAILLTYIEVGDFVTFAGNFYLAKMEHEATELQHSILESSEAARRRASTDDKELEDGPAAPAGAKPVLEVPAALLSTLSDQGTSGWKR